MFNFGYFKYSKIVSFSKFGISWNGTGKHKKSVVGQYLLLKVLCHEIFLSQNMLPINAFIRVEVLFSSVIWKSQVKKYWSMKLWHGFLVALIIFSIDSLLL